MGKKRIGIDINEVLRALWNQFDKYYIEEFGDENVDDESEAYTMNFWEDYRWDDKEEVINYLNEELPEDISPVEYQIDPETGEAPVDHMAFRPKTEHLSARDVYKRFMFQDYCLEIFGMGNMMYKNENKDLERFYLKYKDQFEISLVSKENWFTIPPTLFFLSKTTSRIPHYHFVETYEEIWDKVDILITANPELLKNIPEGKKVVKITRPFNEEIKTSNFEVYNVVDLLESYVRNDDGNVVETIPNKDFDKLIGYKENNKTNK